MKCKVFLFLFSVSLGVHLYGSTRQVGIPLIKNYSPKEFKANNDTWAIVQDDRGILYFGNSAGILEFDGTHWKNIAPGMFAYKMIKDKNGRIYVGLENNFGIIDYTSNGEARFESLFQKVKRNDEYVGTVYNIEIAHDTVYFLAYRGSLFKWANNTLTRQELSSTEKNGFRELNYVNNKMYIQDLKGLNTYNGSSMKLLQKGAFFSDKSISGIYPSGPDTIIIITRLQGIYTMAGNTTSPLHSATSEFLKVNQAYQSTRINSNIIAIGTITSGVLVTDKKGNILQLVNREGGLISNDHCAIFTDSRNNIWSGLENGISCIFYNSPFSQLNELTHIPMSKIYCVLVHDKYFYVGTAQGLYYADWKEQNQGNLNFHFIPEPGVRKVFTILELDHHLFISSSGTGTFEVIGNKVIKITREVFTEFMPYKKDYFVGTMFYGGIGVFKKINGKWSLYKTFEDFPISTNLVIDQDNRLWMNQKVRKLVYMKLNETADSVKEVNYIDSIPGVPTLKSIVVLQFNKELIFSTRQGFFHWFNNTIVPFTELNTRLGNELLINSIRKDIAGNHWFIGTQKGDDVIGTIPVENKKITMASLGRISNLLISNFYPYDNKNVFIGTSERLIHYNPSMSYLSKDTFSVFIRSVELIHANDSLIFAGTFMENGRMVNNQLKNMQPVFSFKNNAVRIKFSAAFYEESERTVYQYMLEGFDYKWSGWVNKTEKEYNYLREGSYTFKVRAKNVFGVQSQVSSYSFKISPPWYRSTYAFALYFFIFILLMAVIRQVSILRLKKENVKLEVLIVDRTVEIHKQNEEITMQNTQLKEQNEEIQAQSQQLFESNHVKDKLFSIIAHDLKSPLGILSSVLSFIKAGSFSEEEFKTEIDNLAKNVELTSDLLDNLLHWAKTQMHGTKVNPSSFDLYEAVEKKVLLYLKQASDKGIDLENQVNSKLKAYADRDMIQLVLRNLITNAIKFCNTDNKITITASNDNGTITVCVADTGIGIPEEHIRKLFGIEMFSTFGTSNEKGTGLGLTLCKEFIALNNGKIWVESSVHSGSRFYFTIPESK
jgi:signal transduction histidine kinase/ligand-binding sensor domain-containing protein